METRYAIPGEIRQVGRGIAGRFPYNSLAVRADRGRVRKETFRPGAFSFSLGDPERDVFILSGHDFDKPLARKSNDSVRFNDTAEALEFEVPELPDTSFVRDLLELLALGLAVGVSPGFVVPPEDVVPGAQGFEPEPGNEDVMIRVLHNVRLFELSIVSLPAYRDSSAQLRHDEFDHLLPPVRRKRMVIL